MKDFELYWREFSDNIKNKNRFFCKPLFLTEIKNYLSKHNIIIDKSIYLYRARLFNPKSLTFESMIKSKITQCENKLIDSISCEINKFNKVEYKENLEKFNRGFVGYDEKESSAPPADMTHDGRANPRGISYLYLAEDELTCIKEIKPNIESWISIGSFIPNKKLKLADIYFSKKDFEANKGDSDSINFMMMFDICFSEVEQTTEDYLATQYISEFIKFLGYDGIIYSSSNDKDKKCYVIFDPSDCKCIESRLCQVTNIEYTTTKLYTKDN